MLSLLLSLFFTFFQIGLFTFGGGYAMISHIKDIVVDKKHWIDDDELAGIIAVAESTPGSISVNLATYIGYKMGGVLGSVLATVGVVLPAFVIMFAVSLFLDTVMENKYVFYAFEGIKCAVAFLILKAGVKMFADIRKQTLQVAMFAAVLALMIILDIFSVSFSSILFIVVGALTGLFISVVSKAKKGDQ